MPRAKHRQDFLTRAFLDNLHIPAHDEVHRIALIPLPKDKRPLLALLRGEGCRNLRDVTIRDILQCVRKD